ncbi:hypothetical protein PIB30_029485 [Stylosanthes scabra]|uniref:Uncharacterized protein n=1 Tax=Stylosanthes scabra TaxID=79078 RepID=A0ABU6RBQ7_9FABA|nr:hypothetical protein [Stylosanthes scabra]
MGSSSAGGSGGSGDASSSMSAHGGSTMRRATVQAYAGEELVPQFDAIEFVSVDDMEQLLLRFCFELQIGAPEFSRSPIIWLEGRRLFAYEVTLPPNRRGIAGRIQGRYSYDENRARQDGVYNMVGHIRRVAGVEVHDFHFEELLALREEADALPRHAYERDAELRTLSDRLNEQEALVADLRTQLKGYEDIFAQVP